MTTATHLSHLMSSDTAADGRQAGRHHSLLDETLVTLSQSARRVPGYRRDAPTNPSTIWRWITSGVALPDGTRIRMEAVRCGNRWLTSAEALARFVEAQTVAALSSGSPTPTDKSKFLDDGRRQTAIEQELERRGA
jgi:hypothetical protein